MLPSASITQLSENGNHYKWDSHPSPPRSPWQKERVSAVRAGLWCLPQKLDCSNSISFFSLNVILPPLPFISSCSPSSPVQATPKWSAGFGDMHQPNPYLSHQNWDWNSNLPLPRSTYFLQLQSPQPLPKWRLSHYSFLCLVPHFLFLPLKGDLFCCHRRDESFLWLLWIMSHSDCPLPNVQITVAASWCRLHCVIQSLRHTKISLLFLVFLTRWISCIQ